MGRWGVMEKVWWCWVWLGAGGSTQRHRDAEGTAETEDWELRR
jgi:hypothetical protein